MRGARFEDNGHYIGHDEPSVKFISHAAGSYPENPCTPDSDTNSGLISDPNAAGSAFMELQFVPPAFAPFTDSVSCTRHQWCAALTIDSLESQFNFVNLNAACEEPVNFAFLQRNGVLPGPPGPAAADLATNTPNGQTLKMNPGDVLRVSITDPAAGFTTRVTDLTTGRTGFMVASAQNGFMNTNFQTCAGTPHTLHAEYSTASQQNQVPWASLEGDVLMQQEIGHFEVCNSVTNNLPFTADNGAFSDADVFQTCMGG